MKPTGPIDLLKAAAGPLVAAALALALLTVWTAAGQAGSAPNLSISDGRIHLPMPGNSQATSAYFTIRNSGDSNDELVSASTPASDDVGLSFHTYTGYAGRMWMTEALPIPAKGLLGMTASGSNIMLDSPKPLRAGDTVPFTLRFRHSGTMHVTAVVVAPGTWTGSTKPQRSA
ncbi:copper chaperone PCu(A)C [Embleya sp. NBC_00896]|uniref:copper chaperone PCu(A)C n=1 Tax=Embleya sp. NBC_00896 TaxID=2975961 RepID=UPI002F9069A5|nr:copper chaperone PCu(A)C [Embleya sp. NBC_00896]